MRSVYCVGIDLGTTFTAAAVARGGHVAAFELGRGGFAMPTAVHLGRDGSVAVGAHALLRGREDPGRLARDFKRRLGDPVPNILGGEAVETEVLMTHVLRSVYERVRNEEGFVPARVAISHPVGWSDYRIELLQAAARRGGIDRAIFVPEPVAAAVFYAAERSVPPGATVAVYDLGGGTFDAAVLSQTTDGFEVIGDPQGIEGLGGLDFDDAILRHVRSMLAAELEPYVGSDDPAIIAAFHELREECTQAKHWLSEEVRVSIPVRVGSVRTEVSLTRLEFEGAIRPWVELTIDALRRAVAEAGAEPEGLHSVLLVGGSSRIPLVGQLVTAALGRPVAVDANPKLAVALGAARWAMVQEGGPARPEVVERTDRFADRARPTARRAERRAAPETQAPAGPHSSPDAPGPTAVPAEPVAADDRAQPHHGGQPVMPPLTPTGPDPGRVGEPPPRREGLRPVEEPPATAPASPGAVLPMSPVPPPPHSSPGSGEPIPVRTVPVRSPIEAKARWGQQADVGHRTQGPARPVWAADEAQRPPFAASGHGRRRPVWLPATMGLVALLIVAVALLLLFN